MRKPIALGAAVLFAGTLGACDQQPTTPDAKASHGGSTVAVTADLDAVDTDAAAKNGFSEGDDVGTIDVTDDQAADKLTVTGSASGLDPANDDGYYSLFYGVGSNATSPNACEPPEDAEDQLTTEQMFIGGWDVASDGTATLGPRTKAGKAYVTVDDIGTVSIRDTRIDAGFGPQAVVACGEVPAD